MTESLPLIPEKGGVCTDVRPVLREVFQEYDYLPPLAPRKDLQASAQLPGMCKAPSSSLHWIEKYDADRTDIWNREGELKQQYAKRLSREPLPNIYKLHPSPEKPILITPWKKELGILDRRDLVPSLIQNSAVDDTLWVKNVLNRSSGELTPMVVRGKKLDSPIRLRFLRENSLQSYSIGEVSPQVQAPPPLVPSPPPAPDHVICVPPRLDFVNFTVGRLHSQNIRLVNVSKSEVRVSIRPPDSLELDVELCSTRGLVITSGAAAELKLHFRPREVRVLRDALAVRVSCGQQLKIPICCYMQPPLLDILVPAMCPSLVSRPAGWAPVVRSTECVELGARLLGDVHAVPMIFFCETEHANFFLLTEDAWLSFSLDVVTSRGSLVAAPFVVSPCSWAGGGAVRGTAWCCAPRPGLHLAALRLLASTGVVRPLQLLADVLHYRPHHVSLQAQEKDYDILSDEDPACEYHVHLGTAFPGRALAATVHLLNHSPVTYSYYWSVRPWGVCSCWDEWREEEHEREESHFQHSDAADDSVGARNLSEELCAGAKEAREKEAKYNEARKCPRWHERARACGVGVEPARGAVGARSSCAVHVRVPRVRPRPRLQRAVLMLILKDIPKESLPSDYDPMIVKTEVIDSEPMPGIEPWKREVCEIVCTQMEVWWEVAPVRFAIDPPILHLDYSRRVSSINLTLRATQLFGCDGIDCEWSLPDHVTTPPQLQLTSLHSCSADLHYSLPVQPNSFPETDVITLEAADGEYSAAVSVRRQCATRHPALLPARCWLGVLPPAERLQATLQLYNDTHQHICWWATPYRWWGENPPSAACSGACQPCQHCHERACTCGIIRPARGALPHAQAQHVVYSAHAPEKDGCVVTLVQARRTLADACGAARGAGVAGRATLLAYRVLAPRLVLRVLPCNDSHEHCICNHCSLDPSARGSPGSLGSATLRPRAALPLARRTCYRLQVTNLTPTPARLAWDAPREEDVLKVIFLPKQFEVDGYTQVSARVVVQARRVCGRRLFLYRARVSHARRPLYLIIDAAVTGLEVLCELPLGGAEQTDSTVIMRRSQAEIFPWNEDKVLPNTFDEIFAEEDRKRATREENICRCKFKMVYIPPPPPPPRPPPPEDEEDPPIQIIYTPPSLTRVCACHPCSLPVIQDLPTPYCLEFHQLPLRTVRSRRVTLRNVSVQAAPWSAAVRRWPRPPARTLGTLGTEEWCTDVSGPGLALHVRPASGVLPPHGDVTLTVRVYASCWGLYRDQLAIKVEWLEPLVVDVWVEAVGAPLQFALAAPLAPYSPILCWMSRSDPVRVLRVKNVSLTELTVHTYTTTQHEREADALPFRLYYRLVDVLPATCPCLSDDVSESESGEWSVEPHSVEMDTGVELFLSSDYGEQDHDNYQVSPESQNILPGAWSEWCVRMLAPLAAPRAAPLAPAALLLRAVPLHCAGPGWFRREPPPHVVSLRHTPREALLRLSCSELRVKLCALDLPYGDVLRVRKRFRVQNVGNGPLEITAKTECPWSLVPEHEYATCGSSGCAGASNVPRETRLPLHLEPRSSLEMCAEVCVRTADAWPAGGEPLHTPHYELRRLSSTDLYFYDDDNVLKTLPLLLELEFPALVLEPALLDFGFVTDGDCRKSYFSVSHTSRSQSIDVVSAWQGGAGFRLHPRRLRLRPAETGRVYIQYTCKWSAAPQEGAAHVRAASGAGAWCRAVSRARAAPARDTARRADTHDHTDDARLLPAHTHHHVCE